MCAQRQVQKQCLPKDPALQWSKIINYTVECLVHISLRFILLSTLQTEEVTSCAPLPFEAGGAYQDTVCRAALWAGSITLGLSVKLF